MRPLRETQTWRQRNTTEKILPLRRYYMIFEGTKTEVQYFNGLISYQRDLGISNIVEIIPLQKEDEIKGHSTPPQLLDLANQYRDEKSELKQFNPILDQMVIVLDLDFFEQEKSYLDYLKEVQVANHKLVVTNPSFEVWLLLHDPELEVSFFKDNFADIMSKTVDLKAKFSRISGMKYNNIKFVNMKDGFDHAIQQEKNLNQANQLAFGQISSNVGLLLDGMRKVK